MNGERPEWVCSNRECYPKRGGVAMEPRSYYWLSEQNVRDVMAGKHVGCARCGSPLQKRTD
jgi:hypothetical protein